MTTPRSRDREMSLWKRRTFVAGVGLWSLFWAGAWVRSCWRADILQADLRANAFLRAYSCDGIVVVQFCRGVGSPRRAFDWVVCSTADCRCAYENTVFSSALKAGRAMVPNSRVEMSSFSFWKESWSAQGQSAMVASGSVPHWALALLVFLPCAGKLARVYGRARRRRRGLCPECGYDLRGSEGQRCPECGAPAESRSTGFETEIAPERRNGEAASL